MWRILARAKPYVVVVGGEVCAECGEVRGREAGGQGVKHESRREDSAILRAYEISKEQICLKIAMA